MRAGECVQVIGLSGAGKSNLSGFIANRLVDGPRFVLADCNRLANPRGEDLLDLIALSCELAPGNGLFGLEQGLKKLLASAPQGLCLLLDRFETVQAGLQGRALAANLRACGMPSNTP